MEAIYDKDYVYKEVLCDECGEVMGYAYMPRDQEVDILMVHAREKKNCRKHHEKKLIPEIEIIGVERKDHGRKNDIKKERRVDSNESI